MPRVAKAYSTVFFDERWRDDNGEKMTLTCYRCGYCGQTFESAYGPYRRCPHCGKVIRFEKGVKP